MRGDMISDMEEKETLDSTLEVLKEYGIQPDNIVNPQMVSHAKGDVLCDDGEPLEFLYFLVGGTVKTLIPAQDKPGLLLGRYVNRGILDETALFRNDGCAHVKAVCETEVQAVSIPFEVNRETLLDQNSFLRKEAENLAATLDQSMNSFFFQKYPFEYMLCSYIAVKRTDAEWVANIEETAEDLNVTPQFVKRCLNLLVNKGILAEGEKGYLVEDVLRFETYNKGLYKPKRKRIKINAGKGKAAG